MNGAAAASTMKNAPAHRVASPPHRKRLGDAMRAFLLLPALLSCLARLAELDEDIQYHRDQPRDRRGADHVDGGLPALRAKAEDYDGREEGGHPAADVFPADTYYRGVNVEAHRTGGVEQEVPGDPARERRDARYREAPRAGPRPGGEDGGKHADLTLYRTDEHTYFVYLDARKVGGGSVLEVGVYPRGLSERDIRVMWPELLEAQSS